jgi:proline racemase/4-hydroxyproline epimerase
VHVIDSHTGGEPTRVILDAGPDLGSGPLATRAAKLAADHMGFCQSIMREPRGQTAMVGALLVPPVNPACITGVIFFDADAVLGMCGHGTIGLTVTLAHLGRIGPGRHKIETPVGVVEVQLEGANTVLLKNIESFRAQRAVSVDVGGLGRITGDVAYGGNWFYIVDPSPIPIMADSLQALTEAAIAVRAAANAQRVGGPEGQPIDHVIFQSPSPHTHVHSRNFVLCPDNSYVRSPCGTGSSARLACLAADGRVAPGQEIVQESVIGSTYTLSYQRSENGGILPEISGQAFVMAESTLSFDKRDPFRAGIRL